MVDVHIQEARAQAIEKEGLAEARVMRDKAEAEAEAIEKRELAEATGVREKLVAEADGLAKKAEAMKALDAVSRDHEEFRLALEQERALAIEKMRTGIDIARAQAAVLAEAFKTANINVVGGDDAFFNRFLGAVSVGKTVEGFLEQSPTARKVLDRVMHRNADGAAGAPEGATNGEPAARGPIDISGALSELLNQADDARKPQLEALIDQIQDLELDGPREEA